MYKLLISCESVKICYLHGKTSILSYYYMVLLVNTSLVESYVNIACSTSKFIFNVINNRLFDLARSTL